MCFLNTFEKYCLSDIENKNSFSLTKILYNIHILFSFRKNIQKKIEYAIVYNEILDAAKKSPNISSRKYNKTNLISEKSFKKNLDMSDEEYSSYRQSVINNLSQYIDIGDMNNWRR